MVLASTGAISMHHNKRRPAVLAEHLPRPILPWWQLLGLPGIKARQEGSNDTASPGEAPRESRRRSERKSEQVKLSEDATKVL